MESKTGRERRKNKENAQIVFEILEEKGVKVTVSTVKTYLSSIPKWKAKLDKPHFSDVHIQRAINESIRLFKI